MIVAVVTPAGSSHTTTPGMPSTNIDNPESRMVAFDADTAGSDSSSIWVRTILIVMSLRPAPRPADLDIVRASYDRAADNYVEMVATTGIGDIRTHPWLKAAMDAFASAVAPIGPVLDVGCGPGTVTAYLADCGIEASGVDLSPRMIDHARRLHPHCTFTVGSATDLDLRPASLGGILGWWSLFNLPRDVLPSVLASFAAALRPGGQLIIATHVGDDDVERTEAYNGVPVQWTTYQWQPEQLIALVQQAGLRPVADLRLAADPTSGPTTVVVAQRDN